MPCLGGVQLNPKASLLIGLLFHSDWRVLAFGWACLPWGLPLAAFGACLGAFLWLCGLCFGGVGLCLALGVRACCGACFGLLWGFGFGCGVWLWLLPLGGEGAQRQGMALFCLHRGLGWGSAVLLGSSGWLVVACPEPFFPYPAGLGGSGLWSWSRQGFWAIHRTLNHHRGLQKKSHALHFAPPALVFAFCFAFIVVWVGGLRFFFVRLVGWSWLALSPFSRALRGWGAQGFGRGLGKAFGFFIVLLIIIVVCKAKRKNESRPQGAGARATPHTQSQSPTASQSKPHSKPAHPKQGKAPPHQSKAHRAKGKPQGKPQKQPKASPKASKPTQRQAPANQSEKAARLRERPWD